MNYLAHAFLSFNDPGILLGNMISDFVKGKKKYDYPEPVQAGITLHRQIDAFTDDHPATKAAKEFFRPHYRLYSGAFVDVVYDHFLATDENEFPDQSLLGFSNHVYELLAERQQWFPAPFAGMFPYMRSQNWLYNYRLILGTQRSFAGIARRATYLTQSETANEIFTRNYQPLQVCYRLFWTDVKSYARKEFDQLTRSGGF